VPIASVVLDCLHSAGLTDVTAVEPAEGGLAALAGIANRRCGPPLFVKSFVDVPADDLSAAEAEGLDVLRERGGIATPQVVLATREVLPQDFRNRLYRAGGFYPLSSRPRRLAGITARSAER
jgi:hypothetical protein